MSTSGRTSAPGRHYVGPADAGLHAQWRQGRRAIVRRHHPDAGGDAEVLMARLVEHDHRFRRIEELEGSSPSTRLPEPLRAAWAGTRELLARTARTTRAAVPLRWPRRRRYIDL